MTRISSHDPKLGATGKDRLARLEHVVETWYEHRIAGPAGLVFTDVLDWHARKVAGRFAAAGILSDGDRVLDIGSGTGELIVTLARLYPRSSFEGIDLSPGMVARGKAKIKAAGLSGRVRASQGSAFELPFPDVSFEVAISSWVLKHFSDEGLAVAWREAYRVLKPGGRLIASEFGPARTPLLTPITAWMSDAQKIRSWEEVALSLERAGFRSVERLTLMRFLIPPLPKLGFLALKP